MCCQSLSLFGDVCAILVSSVTFDSTPTCPHADLHVSMVHMCMAGVAVGCSVMCCDLRWSSIYYYRELFSVVCIILQ